MDHRMNPQVKAEWIKRLRSGDYKKGQSRLRQEVGGEEQFCCLGVLTDMFFDRSEEEYETSPRSWTRGNPSLGVAYDGGEGCGMPSRATVMWAGGDVTNDIVLHVPCPLAEHELHDDHDRKWIYSTIDRGYKLTTSLTELNDSCQFTFNQIADVIEWYF